MLIFTSIKHTLLIGFNALNFINSQYICQKNVLLLSSQLLTLQRWQTHNPFKDGRCSSVKTTTDDGRQIVKVALSAEVNPPFLATNDRNEPIGYNIDYLNEVEKRLPHIHFDYIFGEEESNLIGIGAGKFEMAANWFFSNPEREKRFLYPNVPYGYSMTGLICE